MAGHSHNAIEVRDLAATLAAALNGDHGDIVVTVAGTVWTIDSAVISAAARTVLDDASVAAMLATLGGQPVDTDLTAIAALVSAADKLPYATGAGTWALATLTAAARTVLDDVSVGAMLTTLGAQPASANLDEYAAVNPSSDALLLLAAADYAAMRTAMGVQAADAELSALAGLVSAADTLPYFTGSGTAALAALTAAARTVLDDTTVSAMLTTLSGGSAHLGKIAALSPTNDEIMQYKAGEMKMRSIANVLVDLIAAGAADLTTAQTMSAKRITPRVISSANSLGLTPSLASGDVYELTAQNANITIGAPTGTPTNREQLRLRLRDNGTSRTLTWNAIYRNFVDTLPTATTINKWHYVDLEYNATETKWDTMLAKTQP